MNSTIREKSMLICMGILMACTVVILLRFITMHCLVRGFQMNNLFTHAILCDVINDSRKEHELDNKYVHVDWIKEYPFMDSEVVHERERKGFSVKQKIYNAEKKVESWITARFPGKIKLVEFANLYHYLVGWNVALTGGYNEAVELYPDGYIVTFSPKGDVKEKARIINEFRESCVKKNANFLLVLAPSKINEKEERVSGVVDFSNPNADDFVLYLESQGIDYLDLRKNIECEGKDWRSLFYRTDSHWTASTGIWAAGVIGEYLNRHFNYSVNLEMMQPRMYKEKKFAAWFLGSAGRKITMARTTPDDFYLYYPCVSTWYHYTDLGRDIDKDGDFSIMYDMYHIEEKDFYKRHPYWTYMGGNRPVVKIKNYMKVDGKKLLIVKDSFANTVVPFLSLGVENIHVVDLRAFDGSLQSYIDSYAPDTVLLLFNIQWLSSQKIDYTSHRDFWDFR